MKISEFLALIIANANKTRSVRIYAGLWYSGVNGLSDSLTTKIGHVIALIQAQIDPNLLRQEASLTDELMRLHEAIDEPDALL